MQIFAENFSLYINALCSATLGAETMYFCHAREQGHVAILNSMQFMTNYKEKIKIGFIERVIARVHHVTCLSVVLA